MGVIEDLHRAREAYERREWVSAYRALSDLDDNELGAQDFAALAVTAYLLGRINDCIQALQRAHHASLAADDPATAFRAAYLLVLVLWQAGETSVGNGWLARSERLLDELPDDIPERGYLSELQLFGHFLKGEFAEAFSIAPRITDYGRRFADPDLLAVGLHAEGRLMLESGLVAAGLQRMDEALVGVLAGEVSPVQAGRVYCSTIEACQEVSDFGRAGDWTRALTNWCDSQPGLVAYTGQCATHRGQILRLHGAYDDAVEEFEHAAERYLAFGDHAALGLAHYERGETLRMRGDHAAAEAAYDAATEHGHPAQPGRALLWLAQGKRDAASAAIRRLLVERQDPVRRSQVLPAAVEVLLAAGEVDEARERADELTGLAEEFGGRGLLAAGHQARAQVHLERGEAEPALAAARRAVEGWTELDAPHELARSRILAGRALRLLGDEDSAVSELASARATLADLGAHQAERDAATLLGERTAPAGLSVREVEVLALVATGMSNPQIAAELTLSEKTVARHLSNIFAKLDVGSRTAAAAFAYEHNLV